MVATEDIGRLAAKVLQEEWTHPGSSLARLASKVSGAANWQTCPLPQAMPGPAAQVSIQAKETPSFPLQSYNCRISSSYKRKNKYEFRRQTEK
jgi:hypothetical protein